MRPTEAAGEAAPSKAPGIPGSRAEKVGEPGKGLACALFSCAAVTFVQRLKD